MTELAYDVLWRHDNNGRQHTALTVDSPGATHTERERIVRSVFEHLERDGLAERGTPHPELRSALALVANADTEFYGWLADGPGQPRTVVTSANHREAVLVERDAGMLRFSPATPTHPAEALVGRLPPSRAGRGLSLNVRSSDVDNPDNLDARTLRRLMTEPRTGLAKLYTARRDRTGRIRRAEGFLTVLDVPTGRWLITTETDTAGQRWVMVNPGTDQTIVRHLYKLNNAIS
ncbi:ESX secretion-associated protein EspG [Saccharothrix luteola]|uniref:ESX secretion-associated protein EspG n=1 Tax=Saccharothrix luteola TaxID=2893018 RepID=UPI001E36ED1B|nr:ESX secretion-associated protein EspG [Saccharothrix luteola]MCC8244988.1 ESX secretion-associated protein EspG [Saccharothrix luteola]